MSFWRAYQLEIVGVVFLLGVAAFPIGTRVTTVAALVFLPTPFTPFDTLVKFGLVIVPYATLAIIAFLKYPKLLLPAFVLGVLGTVSEVDKLDNWLRRNRFISIDRKPLSEYLWEISLKTLWIIFLLGAIIGLVGFAFFGISRTKAMFFFGLIAVPLVGTILYFMRMNHRLWYGVSEIVFALLLAMFTIYKSFETSEVNVAKFFTAPNLIARVLALSTSVYIVVRGWDNIGEHRVKRLRDLGKQQLRTVWSKLLNVIRRRRPDHG